MRRIHLLILVFLLLFWGISTLQRGISKTPTAAVLYYLDVESGPPGVFVTINGVGFSTADAIWMGETRVYPLPSNRQYLNRTPEVIPGKLTFQVPALPPGRYPVTVETPEGHSNPLIFVVRPGRIFWTAPDGADNNPGTIDAPWRTLDHAARQMKPGDFVYLRQGIYRQNADRVEDGLYWGGGEGQEYAVRNQGGEPGRPVTVQAHPGEVAQLTMQYWKPGVININGAHYINLVNLTFRGIEASGINVENSVGVRIVNCEFYDIAWVNYGTGAIWIWTNTDSVKILGNALHDVGAADSGSNVTHAIYAQGQNMEIAYNKIWDQPGMFDNRRANSGIQVFGRETPVWNARIHHNLIFGIQRGIIASGAPMNCHIYQNIFHDLDRHAIEHQPWAGGEKMWIYNNTFYNNGRKPAWWERQSPHIFSDEEDAGDLVIKNNIFYSEISEITMEVSALDGVDYNIYYVQNGVPTLTPGAHSHQADPLFVDVARNDVRLQPESPAIDAGEEMQLTFFGRRPDIGAIEFGGSAINFVVPEQPLKGFILFDNFPDPFGQLPELRGSAGTTIAYTLRGLSEVTLQIFDLLGREVRTLVQEVQPPGNYQVPWQGENNQGQQVAGSTYFFTLTVRNRETGVADVETRQMVLVR